MSASPDQNPLDGVSANDLIAELETQLGRAIGELSVAKLRLARRDELIGQQATELTYLRSLQPADTDPIPEG